MRRRVPYTGLLEVLQDQAVCTAIRTVCRGVAHHCQIMEVGMDRFPRQVSEIRMLQCMTQGHIAQERKSFTAYCVLFYKPDDFLELSHVS